jgi:hypothetical protein
VLLWIGYQASAAQNIASVTGVCSSWTRVLAQQGNADCYIELWWGVASAAGTVTATLANAAKFDSCAWDVDQCTGVNSSAPFVAANTVSTSGSGSTHTLTYAQAAAAGNVLVAALSYSVGGQTFTYSPAGWANVGDGQGTGTFFSETNTAWDSSPGGTTSITWTCQNNDTAPSAGVELAAGSGSTPVSGSDSGHGTAGAPVRTGVGPPVTAPGWVY